MDGKRPDTTTSSGLFRRYRDWIGPKVSPVNIRPQSLAADRPLCLSIDRNGKLFSAWLPINDVPQVAKRRSAALCKSLPSVERHRKPESSKVHASHTTPISEDRNTFRCIHQTAVTCCYERMDAADIRRAVLRKIIAARFNGVDRQLALYVNRSEAQINDMLSIPPRKSSGEKLARSLELALNLPSGFLDNVANMGDKPYSASLPKDRRSPPLVEESIGAFQAKPAVAITDDEQTILEAFRLADERLRRIMLVSAREVIESFSHRNEYISL